MKTINSIFKISAFRAALLIGSSVLALQACKNPIENVNVNVNTQSLSQSPTLVKFVKANPAGPEIPASMSVTISGPGKDLVQADNGGKTFKAANGLLPLTLSRFAKPTPNNPVVFTVSAQVDGYAPISTLISISSPDEVTKVELPMLAYSAPAKGTAVVQTEKPLNAGVAATELKIETTPTATTPQAATITIPSGTQMLDANKQLINAGSVKASVVYYGTTEKEGLKAGRNLMVATNPIGPNNQQINGEAIFIYAGTVSINITAGDKQVKHFSKPITVEVDLNPEMLNPLTEQLIKAGDVIPVWSRNEETGQWAHEGSTTVTTAGGKLKAVMYVNHLSDWAPLFTSITQTVTPIVTFTPFTSIVNYVGYNFSLLYRPLDFIVWRSPLLNWSFNLPNLVSPRFFRVGPYQDSDEDSMLGEYDLSGGNQTISLPAPAASNLIDTEISVNAVCTNKKVTIKPDDTWVVLKDVTDNTTTEQLVSNGKLDLKLKDGHEYTVTAIYDGKSYTSPNIKIDKNTTINVNNGDFNATGAYDNGLKKLILSGQFPIPNCK